MKILLSRLKLKHVKNWNVLKLFNPKFVLKNGEKNCIVKIKNFPFLLMGLFCFLRETLLSLLLGSHLNLQNTCAAIMNYNY